MKKYILSIVLLLLMPFGFAENNKADAQNNQPLKGSIRVLTTPDLYPLTTQWATAFTRLHPAVHLQVIKAQESTIARHINTGSNLAFVSGDMQHTALWRTVVGRDVIVPVLNANNPYLSLIDQQGIAPEALTQLFEKKQHRSMLLNNGKNLSVHYYMTEEASVNTKVARFLKLQPATIKGMTVSNSAALVAAIQKDPYALGFCRLADVIDLSTQQLVKGIRLMPIDRNANGRMDYFENFYGNLSSLSRAIWLGKYPRSLSNNIYSVASEQPKNTTELAFLKWIYTDGQPYLMANGFNDLALNERQSKLEQLNPGVLIAGNTNETASASSPVLYIILGILILVFVVTGLIRNSQRRKTMMTAGHADTVFDRETIPVPKGLYFDKSHTWAFMEKDGLVKVGIDDFLPHTTGLLTRLKLKQVGDQVKKGEPVITLIQHGKQLNINAPVSGTIRTTNPHLDKDPTLLNTSPYNKGWVYTIEPTNWLTETRFLKMAEAYKAWITGEYTRLKDFLAAYQQGNTSTQLLLYFQDGGELKDSVLESYGPELWEDFQRQFIDTAALR